MERMQGASLSVLSMKERLHPYILERFKALEKLLFLSDYIDARCLDFANCDK